MGSNNVVKAHPTNGSRLATIDVGAGPTGLVLDETRSRLYVLNRFEATVSSVNLATNLEVGRVEFLRPDARRRSRTAGRSSTTRT